MITRATSQKEILSLAPACKCSACSHGCSMGSGFLADADVQPMAAFLKVSEEELKKNIWKKLSCFIFRNFVPN